MTCLARTRACAPYSLLIIVLHACAPYASLIRACAPSRLTRLRAFTLTNKRLTRLFWSCVVLSILRCCLKLKNVRKARGPDFIPLKVIKLASNVIDSYLYNITIKDLEKGRYS